MGGGGGGGGGSFVTGSFAKKTNPKNNSHLSRKATATIKIALPVPLVKKGRLLSRD